MLQNLNWWPWLNLLNDFFICFLILFYLLFIFYTSQNLFYVVFYLFLIILNFGILLCLHQAELFTGFLWTIECVIIFALLLLLFFFKTTGTFFKILQSVYFYMYSVIMVFGLIAQYYSTTIQLVEFTPALLNTNDLYDNYYESLLNNNVNDFMSFLLSYYTYNSLELVIVGILILIASLICVNLNKLIQKSKIQNFSEFLTIFNFFKNYVVFSFMRQQNLTTQFTTSTSTRVFKKKPIE